MSRIKGTLLLGGAFFLMGTACLLFVSETAAQSLTSAAGTWQAGGAAPSASGQNFTFAWFVNTDGRLLVCQATRQNTGAPLIQCSPPVKLP
jgi:hypothetical protein